jgi:O-antigen/teichoic acid export membrane protein
VTAGRPRRGAAARLAHNAGLTATAEVLSKLAALVFFALVARRLGDETLGDWVFALAVSSLIWSFAGLGLDRMGMRDMARDPAAIDRLVVPMAAVKGAAALLMTAVAASLFAALGEGARVVTLVAITGAGVAVGLSASTAQTVFAASERMELYFFTKVPWGFANAQTGSAIVLAGGGIVLAAAVSNGVVALVGITWSFVLVARHFGAPSRSLRVRTWPGMLRRAVPFTLQEMLGQIVFRFDMVLLALLTASAVVGAYGAAYRMLEATLFLVWSIGYAVVPMYSYLQDAGRRGELAHVYEGSLKLALIVMAPIATTLVVCAEPVVDLVYGLPQYDDAVPVLRLLGPAIAAYAVGHLAGMLVLVRRPGRVTVIATGAVAAFNVAACLLLIPWLDAEGAAVATLASELLLAVLGLWLARRAVPGARLGWALVTPLLAAGAMAAAMLPLAATLWLALPVGAAVYAGALLLLERRRLRDDLAMFRSIAARRPEPVMHVEEPAIT